MRPSYRHLILLYLLLLTTSLAHSQRRQQDTLVLHFGFDQHTPIDSLPRYTPGTKKIDSVFITGYTDKTGTTAYNERLSRQRAEAAASLLRQQFTQAPSNKDGHWRLTGGGVAPTPQQTDSANRRAEIILSYTILGATTTLSATPPVDSTPVASLPPSPTSSPDTLANRDSTQPVAVISLQHINFIVDTPIPTDSTRKRLPGYVSLLQQYKDRRLEIDGYVNSVVPLRGANDPLFKLSVRRAKFIYDYLVGAGFDPGRLSYKGMGNASPVNPDPVNRAEMDANMRVEIKVF